MPEGNFTGNLSEDQTKCLGRGTDGVTGSAAMLLLGVFFESTGIVHSYGVLLLGTRHRAQGSRLKAQGIRREKFLFIIFALCPVP